MSIKLNKIQLNSIYYENETIVDGETWKYVRHDEGIKKDDHGKYEYLIFKRPSDNKLFRITMFFTKNDEFYVDFQDGVACEVGCKWRGRNQKTGGK